MRPVTCLVLASLSFLPITVAGADDVRPVSGELSVAGKAYKLTHVAAYEAKRSDEPHVVVIASDRPINTDEIKKVLRENDGEDEELSLRQTHVQVAFEKSGKVSQCVVKTQRFFGSAGGGDLTGELKLEANRAVGKATLSQQGEGDLARGFELQFSVGLLGTPAEQAPQAAPLAKLGVTGKFQGNGKAAKLAFVSALSDEPFADKPSLMIVMTEKDHSRDKKPDFKASFGDYGSALIIRCHEDGSIFGCQVVHAAHEKQGFSSVGSIEMADFQIAGGQVQGKLTTGGQAETFGETWEVEVTFAAPFATPNTATTVKPADKPSVTARPEPTVPTEPKPQPEPKPAAAKLNVKDLAILKGVEGVEYKKLVEHVAYKSKTNYKTLAAEIAKQLAAQGWKSDGSDLVGASAILNRTRGDASLTIFVKPDGSGSAVTIFTEGLTWEE